MEQVPLPNLGPDHAATTNATDLLLKAAIDYLQQFHPFQLVAFGMFYSAMLFILLPRISHGISSILLLLTAINQIHSYQKVQTDTASLELQIQTLGIIGLTVLMQLYCMGKTFTIL